MKAPPVDLDTAALVHTLQRYWQIEVSQLDYLAVGFGAHHWRAITESGGTFFLALHELEQPGGGADGTPDFLAQLEQTFGATKWLAETAELDFVVGPVVDRLGTCCRRVADRFALSVYPWLDCAPMRRRDSPITAECLARLHAVAPRVPSGLIRAEEFRIPYRIKLEDALRDLDLGLDRTRSWHTGPYADRARELLRSHSDGVHALLVFYDAEASWASSSRAGWVVTHGQPFGPNLLQCLDGRLRLVDWDSLLIAPRERGLVFEPWPSDMASASTPFTGRGRKGRSASPR